MPNPDIAPTDDRAELTNLLFASRSGGAEALERVFPVVYDRLRAIAHAHLARDGGGHTVSTTVLVHEAYLRLVDASRLEWQDRNHFFSLASRAMRQILIDHARKHLAARRGGGMRQVDLDDVQIAVEERADTLIALDDALSRLAVLNPRLARVVELRFFGGLTDEEAAGVLEVTDRTVRRDWIKARGWLHNELQQAAT
jgi:RNA polymerase sigma factor (TIGR02999 family)